MPCTVLIMKGLIQAELFIPPGSSACGCSAVAFHSVFLSGTQIGITCHQSVRPGEALPRLLFLNTWLSLSREADCGCLGATCLSVQPDRNIPASNPFPSSFFLLSLWLTDYQDISAYWVITTLQMRPHVELRVY